MLEKVVVCSLGAVEAVLIDIGNSLCMGDIRVGIRDVGCRACPADEKAVICAYDRGEDDRGENIAKPC